MDQNNRQCTACFQCSSGVAGHASITQSAALRLFTDLVQSGQFPVMCQRDNGRFHVCHDPRDSALSVSGVMVRQAA